MQRSRAKSFGNRNDIRRQSHANSEPPNGVLSIVNRARCEIRQAQSATTRRKFACTCPQLTPRTDERGAGASAEMRKWRASQRPLHSDSLRDTRRGEPSSAGKTPFAGANSATQHCGCPTSCSHPDGWAPYRFRATATSIGRSQCPPALGFLWSLWWTPRFPMSAPVIAASRVVSWRPRPSAPREELPMTAGSGASPQRAPRRTPDDGRIRHIPKNPKALCLNPGQPPRTLAPACPGEQTSAALTRGSAPRKRSAPRCPWVPARDKARRPARRSPRCARSPGPRR